MLLVRTQAIMFFKNIRKTSKNKNPHLWSYSKVCPKRTGEENLLQVENCSSY